jgi:hypothetical protein
MAKRKPDVTIESHGSIVLIRPWNKKARGWIDEKVAWEQCFGGAIVCEPRYVSDIVRGLLEDGFEVVSGTWEEVIR